MILLDSKTLQYSFEAIFNVIKLVRLPKAPLRRSVPGVAWLNSSQKEVPNCTIDKKNNFTGLKHPFHITKWDTKFRILVSLNGTIYLNHIKKANNLNSFHFFLSFCIDIPSMLFLFFFYRHNFRVIPCQNNNFLEGLHLTIFKSLQNWLSYTIQWFEKVLKILIHYLHNFESYVYLKSYLFLPIEFIC